MRREVIELACAALLLCVSVAAQEKPPVVIGTSDAQTLAQALIGSGVSLVSGSAKLIGAQGQAGTFSGGPTSTVGFPVGIVLSTGLATSANARYQGPGLPSINMWAPGDPDLAKLAKSETFDASILEFSFTSTAPTVYFKYTFASAEYPKFENTAFNDVFAFYINGVNYAVVPGTQLPVSVNNVNSTTNSAYFGGYNKTGSPSPYGAQTKVFTFSAPVKTTGVNTIRLAIADAADDQLDSAVFIQGNSLSTSGDVVIDGPCPPPSAAVGENYAGFTVYAAGGTPPYTFETVLPNGIKFDPATGLVSGTPTELGELPISITVTDSASKKATYTCKIPVGKPSPSALKITGTCVQGLQNAPYALPLTVQGGSGSYSISFDGPTWLILNTRAGTSTPGTPFAFSISGIGRSLGSFPITVTVSDTANNSASFKCNIVIAQSSVRISSGCPASTVAKDVFYSFDLAATGSPDGSNYTWSIPTGSLPAGLRLSGDRILGSPDGPVGSNWRFTLGVSSGDYTDQMSCTMSVTATPLRIQNGCPADGKQDVPYGPFPLNVTGGLGPSTYTYTVNGALPDGVALKNGSIVGVPTKAGAFAFSIQVASGTQTATSSRCSVKIAPPPLDIAGACPAAVLETRTPISATFAGVGGVPPYVYNLAGPEWLKQTAGVVTGIAPNGAEGPSGFRITVTDAANSNKAMNCAFDVVTKPIPETKPTIAGTCPASRQAAGTVVVVPLAASGGEGPYTWSLSASSQDVALISNTGAVTAVRAVLLEQGQYTFTATLTDFAGQQAAPLKCSMDVGPAPLTLTPVAACPATPFDLGAEYTQAFAATGGKPPYKWTVSPAESFNLSSDTDAEMTIKGILSNDGEIPLVVTLTDSAASATLSYACTLNVKK